eukprot:COSAG02_NODE_1022_length_15153_cov_3.631460_13_plen_193_part_00
MNRYMFHRVSGNPSGRARFIANNAIVLKQPMCFNRPDAAQYSLVELAVLRALGVDRLDFRPTAERTAIPPGPFRDDTQRAIQAKILEAEKVTMTELGHAAPTDMEQWCVDSRDPSATTCVASQLTKRFLEATTLSLLLSFSRSGALLIFRCGRANAGKSNRQNFVAQHRAAKIGDDGWPGSASSKGQSHPKL